MLSDDQIHAELKKAEGRALPLTALLKLAITGGPLREVTEVAFTPRAYDPEFHDRSTREERAFQVLAAVPARRRTTYFNSVLPRLAPYVSRAWDLQSAGPYQSGWTRKAFRAPGNDALLAYARGDWFVRVCRGLARYKHDIRWMAAWAGHFDAHAERDASSWLLAAAIDEGKAAGEEVLDTLVRSAKGEHEVGVMGRHVTEALLKSSRPDAWEFIGRLLLSAQREEGLRQAILEAVDQAHPGAFRYMIRLILEERLARFAATVRAVDTWFGFMWDAASGGMVNKVLERVLRFLDDGRARAAGIGDKDPETAYLALWCEAFENAPAAVPIVARFLKDATPERRFIATHLLVQLETPESDAALVAMLDDSDLRIAARALGAFGPTYGRLRPAPEGLFDALLRLSHRVERKETKLKAIVWPWHARTFRSEEIGAALVENLGDRPPQVLEAVLPRLGADNRAQVAYRLGGFERNTQTWRMKRKRKGPLHPECRPILLGLLTDPSMSVRSAAFEVLGTDPVADDEVAVLEGALSRKSSDLRALCLGRLLQRRPAVVLESAKRLIVAPDLERRLAGLELLRALRDGPNAAAAVGLAEEYRWAHPELEAIEAAHVDAVLGKAAGDVREECTLSDALGLLAGDPRSKPETPNVGRIELETGAALQVLREVSDLLLAHKEVEIAIPLWGEAPEAVLLGDASWRFPSPRAHTPIEEDSKRLPLLSVWRGWLAARGPRTRDDDRLELLRAFILWKQVPGGRAKWVPTVAKSGELSEVLEHLLEWCVRLEPAPGVPDFVVNGLASAMTELAGGREKELRVEIESCSPRRARIGRMTVWEWKNVVESCVRLKPADWTVAHDTQLFRLMRWAYEVSGLYGSWRPSVDEVIAAFDGGAAVGPDLIDSLVRRSAREGKEEVYWAHRDLETVSSRKGDPRIRERPDLARALERVRTRLVEVELARGERPSPAARPTLALQWSGGLDVLARALGALGKDRLERRTEHREPTRGVSLAHIIATSFPAEGEGPEEFSRRIGPMQVSEARLLEVAMFAPQWAGHMEKHLGWQGLEEGVWWLRAHTKHREHWSESERREAWTSEATRRTPLAAEDLVDGAVDVAWFGRVLAAMGKQRWLRLDAAAKYATEGVGHKRAQLFAAAIMGTESRSELIERVQEKRHQDAARALGLLPLPGGKGLDAEVLARYRILQEFKRGSRKFGSQRQASEKRAYQVAMDNLARTAGFPDPTRLQWAMETESVKDLAAGPVVVTIGETAVKLAVNADGRPELTVVKNSKVLAAVPAAIRRDERIIELKERAADLRRQASRMRQSLEDAMCRGDAFLGSELPRLLKHPVLSPMLRRLVFARGDDLGYLQADGTSLSGVGESFVTISATDKVRIAHAHDLFISGAWDRWQRDCFAAERVQPIKQVFRELYPLTPSEREGATSTTRYEGQQVNPSQAVALLGRRGWVVAPEEGVHRTYHEEGLTAWLVFEEPFFTPSEIDGLTLAGVGFTRRADHVAVPLASVPPRVFSEAMRDLDLVVSVAHRSGVDPEATGSTVEMRAALLRETCTLLGLSNVRIKGMHAIIDGTRATYSLHLGSAVTHVTAAGALFIVPVHSQFRGRLFLPFADDDPKSAEVMTKAIYLARDDQIKDPNVLEQILSRRSAQP